MTTLPLDPPRYRITGNIPAKDGVPALEFYTYNIPWGDEDEALETLENMKKNMPPGTSLVLESTRDKWERVKGVYVPVPRSIKDSPQA